MLVSTKGRYALRVMIDLAEHQSEDGDGKEITEEKHRVGVHSFRIQWEGE